MKYKKNKTGKVITYSDAKKYLLLKKMQGMLNISTDKANESNTTTKRFSIRILIYALSFGISLTSLGKEALDMVKDINVNQTFIDQEEKGRNVSLLDIDTEEYTYVDFTIRKLYRKYPWIDEVFDLKTEQDLNEFLKEKNVSKEAFINDASLLYKAVIADSDEKLGKSEKSLIKLDFESIITSNDGLFFLKNLYAYLTEKFEIKEEQIIEESEKENTSIPIIDYDEYR